MTKTLRYDELPMNLEPEEVDAMRERAALYKSCRLTPGTDEPDYCRTHSSVAFGGMCEAKRAWNAHRAGVSA